MADDKSITNAAKYVNKVTTQQRATSAGSGTTSSGPTRGVFADKPIKVRQQGTPHAKHARTVVRTPRGR